MHVFPEELKAAAEPHNIKLQFVLVSSNGEEMNTLKEQVESGRTVGKAVVTM